MRVKKKVSIFDYQSGKSQGTLIHVLGMNPVFESLLCSSALDTRFLEALTIPLPYVFIRQSVWPINFLAIEISLLDTVGHIFAEPQPHPRGHCRH